MAKQKPLTDLEKLQEVWYKKLETTGFVDIERHEKHFKSYIFRDGNNKENQKNQYSRTYRESKIEYYQHAYNFLNEYEFNYTLEQVIWEYHANGISVRDITETLEKTKVIKTNRTTVWQTVKRLRGEMKKMYGIR